MASEWHLCQRIKGECYAHQNESIGSSIAGRIVPEGFAVRRPRRINVTVSETLLEGLQRSADDEGRSLSNLCAYLLEIGLERRQSPSRKGRRQTDPPNA